MRDYKQLTTEWEELLETLRCGEPDLDDVKHLIFDTYWFLKSDLKGDSIPRNQLELYKYICQVCQSTYESFENDFNKTVEGVKDEDNIE